MYEANGERYFVLDSHSHFWDASPENWVEGEEQYAKGWIECFHAYQSLGPPETHWSIEHFMKYSVDDYEKDVFTDGHVDMAIFQSTYLKQWYKTGFNAIEQNAALLERFGDRVRRQRALRRPRGRAGPAPAARGPRRSTGCRASSSTPPSGWDRRADGR